MKSLKSPSRTTALSRRFAATLCATLALWTLMPPASAMVIEGVRFDDATRLGGCEEKDAFAGTNCIVTRDGSLPAEIL